MPFAKCNLHLLRLHMYLLVPCPGLGLTKAEAKSAKAHEEADKG